MLVATADCLPQEWVFRTPIHKNVCTIMDKIMNEEITKGIRDFSVEKQRKNVENIFSEWTQEEYRNNHNTINGKEEIWVDHVRVGKLNQEIL
jgi:hypothetical protein